MKLLKKLLIWYFIIITIVSLSLYLFVEITGNTLLEDKLTEALGLEVSIEDVRFIFPLGLRFNKIEIKDMAKVEEVRVQVGLPIKFGNEYFVSSVYVVNPNIHINKNEDRTISFRASDSEETKKNKEKKSSKKKRQEETERKQVKVSRDFGGIIIEHLEVSDGSLSYSDLFAEKKLALTFNEINLKAQKVVYPMKPVKTKYNFSSVVLNENKIFSGSKVQSDGWIDFYNKDMDGKLKIVEANGAVGLKADLKAKDNDLSVKGKLNVKALSPESDKPKESGEFSVNDFVMEALESAGVEINADFAFTTKLDDIRVNPISLSGKFGVGATKKSQGLFPGDLKNIGAEFFKKNIEPVVAEDDATVEQVKDLDGDNKSDVK